MPHRLQYFGYHLVAPWNTIEVVDVRYRVISKLNHLDHVLNHCYPTPWPIVNHHLTSCNLVVGDRSLGESGSRQ